MYFYKVLISVEFFATFLGADPHNLSFDFTPLMGMVVQPIVGII